MHEATWALRRIAEYLEYLRVRQEILEGENPEINTDRVVLVSRFRALGFSGPLEALLQKTDEALATAADAFDLKRVMELVRSAVEQIAEQSARAEAALVHLDPKTLGETPSRFSASVAALHRTGLLSNKEQSALQAFYNMLSVDGAHAWGSAHEQARLSKNMMIEWGVLILNRVRKTATVPRQPQ